MSRLDLIEQRESLPGEKEDVAQKLQLLGEFLKKWDEQTLDVLYDGGILPREVRKKLASLRNLCATALDMMAQLDFALRGFVRLNMAYPGLGVGIVPELNSSLVYIGRICFHSFSALSFSHVFGDEFYSELEGFFPIPKLVLPSPNVKPEFVEMYYLLSSFDIETMKVLKFDAEGRSIGNEGYIDSLKRLQQKVIRHLMSGRDVSEMGNTARADLEEFCCVLNLVSHSVCEVIPAYIAYRVFRRKFDPLNAKICGS